MQIWNYESLETLNVLGLDFFETSISSLAFSSSSDGDTFLAVTDSETKPNLSVWTDVTTSDPKMMVSSTAG